MAKLLRIVSHLFAGGLYVWDGKEKALLRSN